MEGWTHALEEADLRGSDMKNLYRHSQFMKDQGSKDGGA